MNNRGDRLARLANLLAFESELREEAIARRDARDRDEQHKARLLAADADMARSRLCLCFRSI